MASVLPFYNKMWYTFINSEVKFHYEKSFHSMKVWVEF